MEANNATMEGTRNHNKNDNIRSLSEIAKEERWSDQDPPHRVAQSAHSGSSRLISIHFHLLTGDGIRK
ncbi:hypothetical protein HanXRQr2_Chr03g0104861 [Helianthus annuus]|uniref:Uncharacterized protein n=1 Tax=Helianthus annuus TaxID=4232 RepID=A0A251V587_HELAN|nr:hypothetical protein HanXRQr2_Chr03g0104861 [Helianthus annuus]KAJ0600255.1 hypothetical protein HanIR_Chr03g0114481 [Helianthus annuus]KAJ0943211.1 hypothetical protein HanPSC8_Chr03g0101361 [Helianthus annuus]